MNKKLKTVAAAVAAVLCVTLAGCKSKEQKALDALEDFGNQLAGDLGNKNNTPANNKPGATSINPFEGLQVTFSGTSPNSKINISGGNSNITYTPSVQSGMKNGDVVTVTAELRSYAKDDYVMTQTSKKYTVNGLTAYAAKIAEIPKETANKMQKQAEDTIRARTAGWIKGNTLKSLDFIGYYMLSAKEGFNPSPSNMLYCVYKVTANLGSGYTLDEYNRDGDKVADKGGEDYYYTYVVFSNILLLEDGTCSVDLSKGSECRDTCESVIGQMSWGSFSGWSFNGYKDIDSMFNAVVAKNLTDYNYENTVKDAN